MTVGEVKLTPAVLARSVDFGEADRVCTFLTRELGRVSALARSARRSRRRFGGALSLFVVGQAALRRGRGELLVLERFEAREDLSGAIAADVVKVAHGSYVLELARELWPPGAHEPALYELVVDALRALATRPASAELLRAFEAQALALCGVLPALERCAHCGAQLADEPATLDAGRGGALCARCAAPATAEAGAARQRLLRLLTAPLAVAAAAPTAEPGVARAMRRLLLDAVQLHLGRELQSLRFIAQLRAAHHGRGGET